MFSENQPAEKMTKKKNRSARNRRDHRFGGLLLACAAVGVASAQSGFGQTSAFMGGGSTGTPTTGDWNTAGNWSPTGVPTNTSTSTILSFGGSGTAYVSTDDVAGQFLLNELLFSSSVGTNYINASTGSSLNFSAGGIISQTGTGGFQINAPMFLSNGLTVSGSTTGAVTLGGAVSGTGGIAYTNGTSGAYLRLAVANTFSGGVNVSSGTYTYIASTTALGTGTFTALGAATLDTSQLAVGSTIANAIALPGSGKLTLNINGAAGNTIFSGNISGGSTSAELYLNTSVGSAAGIFEFSNANSNFITSTSATGGIVLNRGTLQIDNTNALGNAANPVYLDSYSPNSIIFGGSITYTHPTYVAYASSSFNTSSNSVLANGVISSATGIGIVKTGSGILTLAATNTYAGTTTVSAGALVAAFPAAFPGYSTPSEIIASAGGTIAGRAGNGTDWTSANLDTLRSAASFASGSSFGIDTTDGNFTYNSNIGSINTAIGFTKLGTNTLTLSPTQSYTGTTNVAGGTLNFPTDPHLTGNLSIGSASAAANLNIGAGTTFTSSGTLYLVGDNSAFVNNITGGGTLLLRNTASSATTPDIMFNLAAGVPDGSIIGTAVDVGTGNRYINGTTGRNDVGRYAGDLRFDGPITGSATVNFTGGAQSSSHNMHFVLNANNSAGFTGGITINAADLALTNNYALTSANPVTFADTSTSTRASLFLFGYNVTIGSLNDTSVAGSTRWIRNGSLVAANGGTDTSGGGTIPLGLNSSSALTINQSLAGTFGGVITDGPNDTGTGAAGTYNTLSIIKSGSANLALTGASNYSGPTIVNQGRLEVDGSLGASSLVSVNSTGTLAGTGNVSGGVTINNGGTIEGGNSGVGTLTIGSLTLGATSGDATSFKVSQTGTIADLGFLNLSSGATATVNVGGAASGFTAGGSYPLITYGGTALSSLSGFSVGTLPSRVLGNLVESTSGSYNSINLSVTGVDFPVWTGAASSQWNTSDVDWVLNSNNATTTTYMAGDSVLFSNLAGAGHTTVNINGGDVFPGGVTFNTSLNYTLAGSNGINGSTGLLVTGGGSLTINNTNSFTGNVNISGATITVPTLANAGLASPLGAGTAIALNAGTLSYTGPSTSNNRAISLGTGGGTINVNNSGSTLTLATALTGSGTLTASGAGTLQLSTANTGFTGPIAVNSSNLSISTDTQLGAVPPSVTPAAITLNGTGTLTTTAGFTLSANRGITGTGSLILNSGTLVMSGSNTYTGGTIMNPGSALSIVNGTELGSGPLTVNLNASSTFLTVANTAAVLLPNNIVLPSPASSFTTQLVKNTVNASAGTVVSLNGNISGGSATLTLELNSSTSGDSTTGYALNGTNSFLGTVLINRGYVIVNNPASLGGAALELDSNQNTTIGNLVFNGSFTLPNTVQLIYDSGLPNYAYPIGTGGNTDTLSGPVTGSGPFQKVGSGTLILTGTNSWGTTYPGAFVSAGTLQFGNGGATGSLPTSSTVNVSSGATVAFNRTGTVSVPNLIVGAGGLTQMGPGTVVLSNTNTYTGPTVINGGKLEVDGPLASSSITVNSGGTLTGIGTLAGPVALNNGGGIATVGTLTVGGLTFGQTSTDVSTVGITTTLSGSGPVAAMIVDNGPVTINSGNNTITVNVTGVPLAVGNYPLIEYNGSASTVSSIASFKLGSLPAGVGAYLNNDPANNSIDLDVTSGDYPRWSGALSSEWVTTTQSSPKNWQYVYAGTPTDYVDGNLVQFDDNATTFTVDISSTNVSPSAVSFLNNSNTYTITGTKGIAGSTGVTMSGSGTVIFSNSNTYTGNTAIKNGTVVVTSSGGLTAGPLGTGTILLGDTVSNGNSPSLLLGLASSTGGVTLSNPIIVQSGSNGTLTVGGQNTSGINTLTGPITIGTGSTYQTLTLLAATGGELDVNGNITDNGNGAYNGVGGSLVLGNGSNAGTIKLNGTNAYGGSTTVNGGTVVAINTTVPSMANGLVINGGATFVSTGTLALKPTTVGSITSGDLLASVSGSGTLAFSSPTASLSHPDLTAYLGSTSYYAVGISPVITLSSGNHYFVGSSGDNEFGQYICGDLEIGNSISGGTALAPANLTISGTPVGTTYIGQFEVALYGNDSAWTGKLNILQGNVALANGNALNATNSVNLNAASGTTAALYLQGQSITIGDLTGVGAGSNFIRNGSTSSEPNFQGQSSTLTVTPSTNDTFNGILSDGPSDYPYGETGTYYSLGLTMAGTSNLTLTGSSTYTGDTNINSGTLTIGGTGALGHTNIYVNAGTLAFGNASTGTVLVRKLTGALNINSGAAMVVASAANHSSRQVIVPSSLSNGGLIDLGNNDMDLPNSFGYQTAWQQIQSGYNGGAWNGTTGITSSAAASDPNHLTALGVILNDDGTNTGTPLYGIGGTIAPRFSTVIANDGDVLVKYTYYGDADLSGIVDGSDYSRVDNAYSFNQTNPGSPMTGWYNGDFNYDGLVDGSDYTLMDNAFNLEGSASLATAIATPTAQLGGSAGSSAVPEPTSIALLGIGAVGLLGRRGRRRK